MQENKSLSEIIFFKRNYIFLNLSNSLPKIMQCKQFVEKIDQKIIYNVEAICGEKEVDGQKMYLLKYTDYAFYQVDWQPEITVLFDVPDLLEAYKKLENKSLYAIRPEWSQIDRVIAEEE